MTDRDLAEQISQLEANIDELAEAAERCRKVIVVSRIAVFAGAICISAMMLGLLAFDQIAVVCSITGVIGGIVAGGSHRTTLQQTMAAISEAEARRSELIDMIELKPVTGRNDPI